MRDFILSKSRVVFKTYWILNIGGSKYLPENGIELQYPSPPHSERAPGASGLKLFKPWIEASNFFTNNLIKLEARARLVRHFQVQVWIACFADWAKLVLPLKLKQLSRVFYDFMILKVSPFRFQNKSFKF